MGGNALKNTETRRYQADEYHKLEREVVAILSTMFPESRPEAIVAYRKKESFGDMDIVIISDMLPDNWVERVKSVFNPTEMVKNGNVLSFERREFQIDLIATKSEDYDSSLFYFAYNDLGNLMGRIAHKMGVKLGHDGLTYKFRDSKDHVFREIIISKDWAYILRFLGLKPTTWLHGFDELEDIFKFVASSEFFNPDIYLLENRNHVSRVRDAKRKTYTEFLDWCAKWDDELPHFQFIQDKSVWLSRIEDMFPYFAGQWNQAVADLQKHEAFKAKFNGALVMEWTGLQGKELGDFMKWMMANVEGALRAINPDVVEHFTKYCFDIYKADGRFFGGVESK